jgi:MYXO-CTERM domain-containing protein
MARQEGGQCTIAPMKRPVAWLLGGFALLGFLRRRREVTAVPEVAAPPDPRADELRRKLAESRTIVEERESFEAAEVTVDRAKPAPQDPESRRRAVHESGRAALERMRGDR